MDGGTWITSARIKIHYYYVPQCISNKNISMMEGYVIF